MMRGSTVGLLLRDGKAALLNDRQPAVSVMADVGQAARRGVAQASLMARGEEDS
jgi:hypothetical protein